MCEVERKPKEQRNNRRNVNNEISYFMTAKKR